MRYFLIVSFSSWAFASTSLATEYAAFAKIDSSYAQKKVDLEIKNMPRITSQDGLGICYAHVAATMMQTENCRTLKIKDCGSLQENQLFSPLDLTRLHRTNDNGEYSTLRSSYKGLDISGGSVHDAIIIGALGTKAAASEECLSLDRILSKMNTRGETNDAQNAMWTRLKQQYDAAKKEAKGKEGCAECLNNIYTTAADKTMPEVEKNLNLKVDNVKLAQAFAQDTFNKFLDDLLGASACRKPSQMVYFENAEGLTYEAFPTSDNATSEQMKDKVKEVLKTGRPLALTNICLGQEPAKSCNEKNFHAVVIAGYRTICNSAGKCRDSFKVVNSWGKSWQDQNDGGWLDADALLGRTKIARDVLGWFADKK
ncbi:hypothetical protein [uncultured Bdellovibrio sp.]|uniref:hypothetical protein n=1 Tax=Bdellovibrio sp. HCB-162 TaxID=3394234 RepID=UPI0025FABD96|nr:hypothetical protein [uncultured Bdellovibrio sp.]